MFITIYLAILSLLNPLISATPLNTNSPNNPFFMNSTSLRMAVWPWSKCDNNPIGDNGIVFDVLYGQNNHGLAVSFMLKRDLETNEQLDMSFFQDSQGNSNNGIDKECALFQYTANPDSTGKTLKLNQCYEPPVPVTCFNLWRLE